MRALVQRVSEASVTVDEEKVGSIAHGLLVFVGIRIGDDASDAAYLADKCCALRIFDDEQGKMNLDIVSAHGSLLAVSQFTLYADTRHGNRPSFVEAAPPPVAEPLYEAFVERCRERLGPGRVSTGVFRAMMKVAAVNDGPVTVMIESKG